MLHLMKVYRQPEIQDGGRKKGKSLNANGHFEGNIVYCILWRLQLCLSFWFNVDSEFISFLLGAPASCSSSSGFDQSCCLCSAAAPSTSRKPWGVNGPWSVDKPFPMVGRRSCYLKVSLNGRIWELDELSSMFGTVGVLLLTSSNRKSISRLPDFSSLSFRFEFVDLELCSWPWLLFDDLEL